MADMGRYEMLSAEIATLSPTELSLMELQRERQDLLHSRGKDNPRIFKNKLTILNNKITYLEDEIKRVKPYVVKQRLVPLTDKAPVRVVSVDPKAAAPHEAAQKKASLAWTPNVTQPKTVSEPAARLAPSEAALPPKKSEPVQVKVELATVGLRPASASALREAAATQVLPVRIRSLPASGSSKREWMQEQTLPPKPAAPSAVLTAKAKLVTGKTGADWKTMTREDKEIYILSVMGNLSRRDVYLMRPYDFYIDAIDRAVEKNPLLEQEFVQRILMMTAYDSEPDSRKDLEKIWK